MPIILRKYEQRIQTVMSRDRRHSERGSCFLQLSALLVLVSGAAFAAVSASQDPLEGIFDKAGQQIAGGGSSTSLSTASVPVINPNTPILEGGCYDGTSISGQGQCASGGLPLQGLRPGGR